MKIQASLKVLPNSYLSREENYKLVDEALKMIKASDLYYEIGCSETTIEGENTNVLKLINKIQEYYFQNDIDFLFFVTFEYNKDKFYIDNKKENISKI